MIPAPKEVDHRHTEKEERAEHHFIVRRCAFKGRRECAVFSETGSGRPPLYFNNPYSRKKGQKYLGVLIGYG